MKDEICSQIANKRADLFSLSTFCGKREDSIAQELYDLLTPWEFHPLNYPGLFGWEEFKSDKYVKLNNGRVIIEVKKVIEKSEYGYWHGLIQSLLYRFHETEKGNTDMLFLCIILDWGRRAGKHLEENEKKFLSQYVAQQIYFLRISMSGQFFMEHNLHNGWTLIENEQESR